MRVCWRAVSNDAVIAVGHRGNGQSILGLAVRRRRHAGQTGDRRSVCGIAMRLRSGLSERLRRGSRGCGGLIFENERSLLVCAISSGLVLAGQCGHVRIAHNGRSEAKVTEHDCLRAHVESQ